ncbi:M48 family metalloprotease [Flavilitoribacter nigricans]|uniref:Peptidase M48 n=1 Tax=Flavilitoribacter nigricans (strain ATCC 23147 / DSM 23189 / NBRC 102662 / NCIMB 1420 / SS-2) TaxID=1122177 RepID=A0A2D0N5W2_FLAN2|nr:M48 family metalloprotease [Flavilitoribacter nigricans]PHN03891.1 peptidase M48 [Flavilitoribacter nigricans DSM 23189 = NBRC 102662]
MKKYAFLQNLYRYALLSVLFLIIGACATNPVTGKRELMLVSEEQEIQMGQQSDPAVVAQFGLYEDDRLQNFINEKGQQMAAISHRPELKYEFKVVDSPVVNAFALPGGFVYFTRGIMAHFNNEAEFAGVLGHEIGHVTARHSARQQTNQTFSTLGLIVGMIAVPEIAQMGETAGQALQLLFLKYSRDHERESDELGVEYSTKIGYDAQQMAGFFGTLDRLSGGSEGRVPTFMSTHPNPVNREKTVAKLASEWQAQNPGKDFAVNRQNYLRMLEGLVYGEDPRQGFVENNNFYHPELKFQFPVPAGWATQNSPTQFAMGESNGKAMMILNLAAGNSLENAAQETVKQYNLNVLDSKSTNINGLSAIELVADIVQDPQQQQQQQQQQLRLHIGLIAYGGNIYRLIGVSQAQTFGTWQRQFTNVIRNFNTLSDPDKLNRQPEKLRIMAVTNTTTLENALRGFGIPSNRLEEFSILNGMPLNATVQKGDWIKSVGQ